MAETAAILCPERTVLLPDLRAGCSLAASVTAEELRVWKARFPDAVERRTVERLIEEEARLALAAE